MWPLSVAVEQGRWVLIRCAMRPGMVASSLLHLSACIVRAQPQKSSVAIVRRSEISLTEAFIL
jgi:hypothetical protein